MRSHGGARAVSLDQERQNLMLDNSPVPNYLDKFSLAGATAIVVGAGAGIGRQSAHALSQVGAKVICVDLDSSRAEAVASEVGGVAVVADACEREGVISILAEAEKTGLPLRSIVDIIGIASFADLNMHTDEIWAKSERLNLRHAYLLAELGGDALAAAGGGTLVYISSISGFWGTQRHAAYGAHKAALVSLVKTAAVELGPKGVRVNSAAPGVIWTERMANAIGLDNRERFSANTPTGRLGEPSDIAGVVSFLATDISSHVNGQSVIIDGGAGVKFPYPVELL